MILKISTILSLCLVKTFLIFSQNEIPISVNNCISNQDNVCSCLDSLTPLYNTDLPVIAYSQYFRAIFCSNSQKEKKDNFLNTKKNWETIGYKGYRYLYANLNIADFYLFHEYNFDSIQKYSDIGRSIQFLEQPKFAHNYLELTNTLARAYRREGDIQKAIDLIIGIQKENKITPLSSENKAWYYHYYASLLADQDPDYYNEKVDSISRLSTNYLQGKPNRLEYRNIFNIARNLQKHQNKDTIEKALMIYSDYYDNYLNGENKERENDLIRFKSNCANAIGECHQLLRNYKKSTKWFLKSIEHYKKYAGAYENRYHPNINSSKSYQQLNKLDSSILVLDQAIQHLSNYKQNINNLSVDSLSNSSAPLQVLNILLEAANTYSLYKSPNSDLKSIRIFEQTIELFHIYFNKLEVTKSKYWKKKEYAKVFDQLIKTASRLNNVTLLFNAIDMSKHSFLSTKENTDVSLNTKTIIRNVLQFGIIDSSMHVLFDDGELNNKYIGTAKNLTKLIQDYHHLLSTKGDEIKLKNISIQLSDYLLPKDKWDEEFLTVLPTANLDKIPFDCLENDNKLLIHNLPVNYQLSHKIVNQLNSKNYSGTKGIALLAPKFKENPNNLYAAVRGSGMQNMELYHLAFAEEEIDKLSSQLKTRTTSSTKENLITALGTNQIVHFSGHAISIQPESDESFLAFDSDIYSPENILTQREIYELESKNDLIVLSACQTASGEYLQNEGTLSLARAFFYAGAKSVISTLWSVNDRSTSIIMTEFYKELLKGKRKDEALRQAKLNYLENADPEYQHPYYWAGFIAMGDMSPLFFPNRKWYYLGFTLLGFGIIGFIFKKKITSNRHAA